MFAPATPALPLKDIYMPPAPAIWPLAPGWWVVLVVTAIALFVAARWGWRRYRRRACRRRLQTLFDQSLVSAAEPSARLAIISQLLRRAARSAAGDAAAQLTGEPWLHWLDGEDPERPFSNGPGRVLLHGPFQASAVAAANLDLLLPIARQRFMQLAMRAPDRPGAPR